MIGLYLEDYGLMAIIILFYLQKFFYFYFLQYSYVYNPLLESC